MRLGGLHRGLAAAQVGHDVGHLVVVAAGEQPVVQRAGHPDRDRVVARAQVVGDVDERARGVETLGSPSLTWTRAEAAGGRAEVEQVPVAVLRRLVEMQGAWRTRRPRRPRGRPPGCPPRAQRSGAGVDPGDRRGRADLAGL